VKEVAGLVRRMLQGRGTGGKRYYGAGKLRAKEVVVPVRMMLRNQEISL